MSSRRRRCADCTHSQRAHGPAGCDLCECIVWLDTKPHLWREAVTDAWLLATQSWLRHREAVAVDYETERREFEENHPRPRLADFMRGMSEGTPFEEFIGLLTVDVCPSCRGTGHNTGHDSGEAA